MSGISYRLIALILYIFSISSLYIIKRLIAVEINNKKAFDIIFRSLLFKYQKDQYLDLLNFLQLVFSKFRFFLRTHFFKKKKIFIYFSCGIFHLREIIYIM